MRENLPPLSSAEGQETRRLFLGRTAALAATLFAGCSSNKEEGRDKSNVSGTIVAKEENATVKERVSPLEEKLQRLDRLVYELMQAVDPIEHLSLGREFSTLCREVASSNPPRETGERIAVLENAFSLCQYAQAGPAIDRDEFVALLQEINAGDSLDSLIKKFEQMPEKDFIESQRSDFNRVATNRLHSLRTLVQARPAIGRGEFTLLTRAILDLLEYAKNDEKLDRAADDLLLLKEEKWLQNFPRATQERLKEVLENRAQAWLTPHGEGELPELPRDLRSIYDPYYDVREAENERARRDQEASRRDLEEALELFEKLRNDSPRHDAEVDKFLERKRKEAE